MTEQYDLHASRKARDEAIETVTENAGPTFGERVLDHVLSFPRGVEVTGEDIRTQCLYNGITPHHHNAWGGTIAGLIKRGILIRTGRYRQMRSKKSHARITQVLRRA